MHGASRKQAKGSEELMIDVRLIKPARYGVTAAAAAASAQTLGASRTYTANSVVSGMRTCSPYYELMHRANTWLMDSDIVLQKRTFHTFEDP